MRQDLELGEAIKESASRVGLADTRPYTLGILLVHGIGEQQRGDTLTEAGDRLVAWLRRCVEATASTKAGKVDVLDVVSRQSSGDAIPTAHAVVRVTPPSGGGPPAHWVVAEARWADAFRAATFTELAGWGVLIGPWVFATQVQGIVQRMEIGSGVPRALRVALVPIVSLISLVMVLLAAIAGLLVTALALAVGILAFTRIPFAADLARSMQRTLASGVGDAYVLTRSPIRFGAMATQVRSDLQALRRACSCVVVIAHSQGTAVAWYAIKHELTEPDPSPPKRSPALAPIGLFLTYGQAIRKLTFMLSIARGPATQGGTIAALCGTGFVLATFCQVLLGVPSLLLLLTLFLAIVAEVELLRAAMRIWQASGADLERDWAKVRRVSPKLEWLDLWASADPVPGGPLDLAHDRIRSYKIRNLASAVLDHVVYWKNGTEFLATVASRLFRLGGPAVYSAEPGDPRLHVAAMRRHARVLGLMTMRLVLVGAVVAASLQAWFTPGFSGGVMLFLKDLHLPLVGSFFDAPPDWAQRLAGVIVVLVASIIAWTPFSMAWSALVRADETTYFRGTRQPLWTLAWYALGGIVIGLAVAVGGLLLLLGNPMLAATYALGTGFATLLGLTVLSSGGATIADAEVLEKPMAAVRKITGATRTSVVAVILVAAMIVAVPLGVTLWWNAAIGWTLAVEALVLAAVLAIEGVREYRLYRSAFTAWNAQLPPSGGEM